jgi:hypothetical protein
MQPCYGYGSKRNGCVISGEACGFFRMTVPHVPLSAPSPVRNSQQRWYSGWSPPCYTPPACVSVTVDAALAACREEHSGIIRIKLHALTGKVAGPEGPNDRLDDCFGAALSVVWLQLNATLGGVPHQLGLDLCGDSRDVRVVDSASIHLNRCMYVMLSDDEPSTPAWPSYDLVVGHLSQVLLCTLCGQVRAAPPATG